MHWTAVEDLSLLATFQSGFPFFHPHISADAKGGRGANEIIQAVFFYTAVVRNDKCCLKFSNTNKQQLDVNTQKHFILVFSFKHFFRLEYNLEDYWSVIFQCWLRRAVCCCRHLIDTIQQAGVWTAPFSSTFFNSHFLFHGSFRRL